MDAPPTILHVHGRDVAVATTRASRTAASYATHTLRQPRPGCLVLRPSLADSLFIGFFAVNTLFCLAAALGLIGHREADRGRDWIAQAMLVVCFLAFSGGVAWMLLARSRHAFDRDEDRWRQRRLTGTSTRPLSDILAVQLLDFGSRGKFPVVELNLVVDGQPGPRVNLTCHGKWQVARRHAGQMAAFLGVPLLDFTDRQTQTKPGAGPVAQG
jgi:hypothetical protein